MKQDSDLCLKWGSQLSDLSSKLHHMLENEKFVDVTLVAAEGHFLKVHRLILCASSRYFEDLLSQQPHDLHVIVILNNISSTDLMFVVEFIYKGKVTVNHDQLPSFLEAASSLKISALLDETCDHNGELIIPKKKEHVKFGSVEITQEKNEDVFHPIIIPESIVSCSMLTPLETKSLQAGSQVMMGNEENNTTQLQENCANQSISITTSNKASSTDYEKEVDCSLNNQLKRTYVQIVTTDQDEENASEELWEMEDEINKSDEENMEQEVEYDERNKHVTPTNSTAGPSESQLRSTGKSRKTSHPSKPPTENSSSQGFILEQSFECSICGNQYKSYCPLRRHLENVHKVDSSQLVMYVKGRKFRSTDPLKCNKCGRVYKTKDTIRRHLLYECGLNPSFSCTHCDYVALRKDTLKRHFFSLHRVGSSQFLS